jgi:chromate transporter
MICLQLFWIFLRIGLISFGGTFGLLPALQAILVDQHHWLTADQFVQSYVVGSFVPGPNMAMTSLLGYRIAGVPGAIACALGIYAGPIAVMGMGCAYYYRNRGKAWVRRTEIALRPLVFALIFSSSALFLRQQLGAQWMLGFLIGVPLAWLDWNRKLGALSCVFISGMLWWVCMTGVTPWL